METIRDLSLKMHKVHQGKIGIFSKVPVRNQQDLSLAYSPGVAEPCLEIYKNPEKIFDYTIRGNLVAVFTNGTAVLGLGDIGARAGLPVMEGKAVLFKEFAGVDAFPICIDSKDVDEIVHFIKLLEPTFSGVNLEDIAAPDCFEIERRLKEETEMAIFHDDQHGTAIVTLAAVLNALKVVGKTLAQSKIVVNGAGASAIATLKLLITAGARHTIILDSRGAIYKGRTEGMTPQKQELAECTNAEGFKGNLEQALAGADIFIGLSKGGLVTRETVATMAKDSIILAMANPDPEIMPDEALAAGAKVVGTGRSDFPNQVNNVLAFPGVFRGALDVQARDINEAMNIAAAEAIARLIPEEELIAKKVIPDPFDPRVAPAVAAAVARAAMESGIARLQVDPAQVEKRTYELTTK